MNMNECGHTDYYNDVYDHDGDPDDLLNEWELHEQMGYYED